MIRLHTCNLLEASIEGETGIGDDLKRIGEQLLGPCERLSWLTKLMLSFAGIFYVFSDCCHARTSLIRKFTITNTLILSVST